MMLKIRNCGSWVVYDRLKRVHFGGVGEGRVRYHVEKQVFEIRKGLSVGHADDCEYSPHDPDVAWLDEGFANELAGNKIAEWVYPAWACVMADDDTERFYVFSEAYLLNDSGQTVEVLK